MSRFANLAATEVVTADCRCDGHPHLRDEVTILTELPYGAEGLMASAGWGQSDKVYNFAAARLKLLELAVQAWNLHGPTGQTWEVTPVTISLLDKETVTWLAGEINTRLEAKGKVKTALPNGSAGSSRTGSSATRSRTRGKPAQPSSTTSS